MSGYNRVILIGNLTRDPEVRYTPSQVAVCDLRLAITTKRGSARDGGERRDETLFIDATVWERNAENAHQYLSKGKPVLVEGRLVEDTWDDKATGEKRSKMKVIVDRMQFLPRNDGGGFHDGGGGDAPPAPPAPRGQGQPAAPRSAPGGRAAGPGGGPAAPRGGQRPAPPQAEDDYPAGQDGGGGAVADDIPF